MAVYRQPRLVSVQAPNVQLVPSPSDDPMGRIWLAYRTCYSPLTPQQLTIDRFPTAEEKVAFIEKQMETEHTTPLEQATFQFLISDVSRTFSHQLVRHRVGVSFAQQSNRYVDPTVTGEFRYVEPRFPISDENKAIDRHNRFEEAMDIALDYYISLRDMGVPEEDARFVLPGAQCTNITMTINFAALLHLADVRLCTRAQWEFRKVVALMRKALMQEYPDMAKYLQPKCGARRQGYCDEPYNEYLKCSLRTVRPHIRNQRLMHPDLDDQLGEYLNRADRNHV